MKEIVVVGCGLTAVLTSLFVKKLLPNSSVKIVKTENEETLKIGQSCTPHLLYFSKFLEIPILDLIVETNATIKSSTKLSNWNGDQKIYFNGFSVLDRYFSFSKYSEGCKPLLPLYELYQAEDLTNIQYTSLLSKISKVPFIHKKENITQEENPILHFRQTAEFSLNFDDDHLNKFLTKLCGDRNIEFVSDIFEDISFDKNNFVQSITLKTGSKINCDFVFDCTDFSRLLINKLSNFEFKSLSKFLPSTKILKFHTNTDEVIEPFSEAISMKSGWLSKIPSKEKNNFCYFFNEAYSDDSMILKEVDEIVQKEKHEISFQKIEQGYFSKPLQNNILSVGLSSNFFEPIEVSPLSMVMFSLLLLIPNFSPNSKSLFDVRKYNKDFNECIEECSSYVCLHYQNKRKDSDFWQKVEDRYELTNKLEKILRFYKKNTPTSEGSFYNIFSLENWYSLASYNKIFTKDLIQKEYEKHNIVELLVKDKQKAEMFKAEIFSAVKFLTDHHEFVKYLHNNYHRE